MKQKRTFKCSKCGETNEVDLAAIAEDLQEKMQELSKFLGDDYGMTLLGTELKCKYCEAYNIIDNPNKL